MTLEEIKLAGWIKAQLQDGEIWSKSFNQLGRFSLHKSYKGYWLGGEGDKQIMEILLNFICKDNKNGPFNSLEEGISIVEFQCERFKKLQVYL